MANSRIRSSNPKGIAAPIRLYYSNVVRVESGPLIFVAGQVALDESGKPVHVGDPGVQAANMRWARSSVCWRSRARPWPLSLR
jgi:enamine deaminase RidA (YjgF/YER057c/UK114 family)